MNGYKFLVGILILVLGVILASILDINCHIATPSLYWFIGVLTGVVAGAICVSAMTN